MQRKEDPTPAPFIEWLPVDCSISNESLADAIARLPPSRVYTIYCGQRAFAEARHWFRYFFEKSSPFTAQVNICVEPLAKTDEWVLVALVDEGTPPGRTVRVGSHGVSNGA
jgi:hypothetical protein